MCLIQVNAKKLHQVNHLALFNTLLLKIIQFWFFHIYNLENGKNHYLQTNLKFGVSTSSPTISAGTYNLSHQICKIVATSQAKEHSSLELHTDNSNPYINQAVTRGESVQVGSLVQRKQPRIDRCLPGTTFIG